MEAYWYVHQFSTACQALSATVTAPLCALLAGPCSVMMCRPHQREKSTRLHHPYQAYPMQEVVIIIVVDHEFVIVLYCHVTSFVVIQMMTLLLR